MARVEEIWPDDGYLPVRRRSPAQMQIQREITRYQRAELIEIIDVSEHRVELDVSRQIDHRLDEKLMMWIIAFAATTIQIVAAQKNPFLEKCVSAAQLQPVGGLKCQRQFRTVGFRAQPVQDNKLPGRPSDRLDAANIVVVVEERRY